MQEKFFKMVASLIVILCFILCEMALADEKVYINGIDANFPPFAYMDKSGTPCGFDVDAINWIAKEMGFKVKHQPMAWDSIVTSLVNKKIDFIASGMSITPERAKAVSFTTPYWKVDFLLLVRKDSNLTVDQILKGGQTIGVQGGTTTAEWLEEKAGKNGFNYKLRTYDSFPLSAEDVINGRIAAAAMDGAPARDISSQKPVKILGEFGMAREDFGYAVRKEDTELLNTLNEGLKRIIDTPYWTELIKKHKLGQ